MKKIKYIDIVIVSLILIALLCIVFKDVIFADNLFVKRDLSRYYYPHRSFTAQMIRQGEIPLWNPYNFCGTPFHASIQNSIFYPLSAIYYILPFDRGFSLFIVFHIFLAGIFMYLFMRACNVSKAGSFLASLAFAFSGHIMSAISLTINLNAVTWFPLAMLAFIKGLKLRSYRIFVLLGIVLTLMFLAGDPSVVISTFAVIFLVSLYLLIESLIKRRRLDLFIIFAFIITTLTFILLGAFQILPAIEYFRQTIRTDMSWWEASAWSMPYSDLLSLVIPYFNDITFYFKDYWGRQAWLDNYYVGITTLIIAGFALALIRKRRIVKLLLALALITVGICLGKYFILYPLLYKAIPLLRIMRYPVRFFFIFTFAVCALAGIGYDNLKDMIYGDRLKKYAGIFLLAAFLLSISALMLTFLSKDIAEFFIDRMNKTAPAGTFNLEEFPSLVYTDIYNTRRTLLYVGYFCFFIFFWLRAKKKKLAVIGIFILLGSDILLANTGYEPTVETGYFKEPTENIRYVMKDESVFRVFASPYAYNKFTWVPEHPIRYGIWSSKDRFVNNRMMEFGLYDMWGYDSTGLRRNVEIGRIVYHLKTPTGNNLLNLFNVKYIAARGDIRNRGYKRVSKTRYAAVYLNKNCLQRAFLVRKPLIMNNEKQMLSYMAGRKFAPEKEIILEEHVELPQQKEANRIKKEKVNILRYRPQRVDIFVVAKMPAFLLLSDTYYPGWQAYIDGKKTHIYRADYFLRAVVVPEGKHIVRFAYEPFSFKVGAIITLFTIAALAIYSLYIIIRKFSRI